MYSCSLAGTALREVSATPRGVLLLSLVLLSLCYHLVCMLNIQTAFSEHGSPHPCRKEENYQKFCHVEETYRRQTSKGSCTSCTHHLHLFTPSVAVVLWWPWKRQWLQLQQIVRGSPGSTQLPAGLLPSSHHRGSCQCIDSYAFASFSQEILTLWSCIHFPRPMSCSTEETTENHIELPLSFW